MFFQCHSLLHTPRTHILMVCVFLVLDLFCSFPAGGFQYLCHRILSSNMVVKTPTPTALPTAIIKSQQSQGLEKGVVAAIVIVFGAMSCIICFLFYRLQCRKVSRWVSLLFCTWECGWVDKVYLWASMIRWNLCNKLLILSMLILSMLILSVLILSMVILSILILSINHLNARKKLLVMLEPWNCMSEWVFWS